MNLSGPNGLTAVLEVRLAPDGTFLGGKLHAARQERPGGPRLDPRGEVIPLARRLSEEDFGAAAVRVEDDGTLRPSATQPTAAEDQRPAGTAPTSLVSSFCSSWYS